MACEAGELLEPDLLVLPARRMERNTTSSTSKTSDIRLLVETKSPRWITRSAARNTKGSSARATATT
jgi:hypothetical protein